MDQHLCGNLLFCRIAVKLVCLVFCVGFSYIEDFHIQFLSKHNPLLTFLSVFVTLMAGIVVHELIHGLTWAYFAKKGFKSIRFGVFWEMLTPYCHCSEPLTVRQYCIGALMPLVVLGIIPLVLAYPLKSILLHGWGVYLHNVTASRSLGRLALPKHVSTF